MMRVSGALLAAILTSFLLTGCTLSGVVQAVGKANSDPAPSTYDLTAPEKPSVRAGSGNWQLIVRKPNALRSLETERILIKPEKQKISYFPQAVWSDKLPRLLQARIIETFQNSRALRGISNGRDRIAGEMALMLEIRKFQVEIMGERAMARASFHANIVDLKTGAIVSRRIFSQEMATSDEVGEAVASLNNVFGNIVKRIVKWTVRMRVPA